MTATTPTSAAVAWRRLGRVIGIAGLATIVLIFVPAFVGAGQEPGFKASATEILTY
jgi:hypothetical protein